MKPLADLHFFVDKRKLRVYSEKIFKYQKFFSTHYFNDKFKGLNKYSDAIDYY